MSWNLDCASDSDQADFTDPATRGAANIYARRLKPGRPSQPGHSVMCVELGTSIPHHVTYRDRNAAQFFLRRSDTKGSSAWNKHFVFFKALLRRTCVHSHPSGSAHGSPLVLTCSTNSLCLRRRHHRLQGIHCRRHSDHLAAILRGSRPVIGPVAGRA